MCVRVEVGSFFLLFREGLVEFEIWVSSSSTERTEGRGDNSWCQIGSGCVSMTQLRIN